MQATLRWPRRDNIAEWAGSSWYALRRHWRRLAVFIAPWLLVTAAGFPLLWYQIEESGRSALIGKRDQALIQGSDLLGRTLDRLGRDVLFLADVTSRFPANDVSLNSGIAQVYLAFSNSVPDYDQVRWLGPAGDELLRINHRGGPAVFAAANELQNKADRPYFAHSIGLPASAVYFSTLDLNVEHGVVENPIQPMLRVASPVFRGDKKQGVVVINYRAQRLLDRLEKLEGDADLLLVNQEGYWIKGLTHEDDWAWQLSRPGHNLKEQRPGLWKAMQSADNGEWEDDSGYWAFHRFPVGSGLLTSGDATMIRGDELGLTILVHVDNHEVIARTIRGKLILSALAIALGLMMLAVALRLAGSLEKEASHTRALQEANQALSDTNQQLRLTQKELARAERLSSLGLMVAGVAHELNTPLGSATLTLSKARQDLAGLEARLTEGLRRSDLEAYLADSNASLALAQEAIRRSTELIQRFKQVAVDRATIQRRKIELGDFIPDADPRLRRWDISTGVRLELELDPGLVLLTYPGPLAQVLTNLISNALSHAFSGREHGCLRIRATGGDLHHVIITVADDGKGIAETELSRIFEPFFTTARNSGGTGLGLHIVHQIVTELLGGTISVKSTTGAPGPTGTTFTLHLPIVAPATPENGDSLVV
ncbi:MAG: ATP-binding protein [Parvibaculaceae bacterium]|nr:ATP-binding protein [Parvibaculaceae bacterium]